MVAFFYQKPFYISNSILKAYEERDGEGQIKNPLRFSSIGKPTRQLWYASRIADQAEPIHPSTRIKFLYGDIIEHLVLLLIKTAGYKVTDEQGEKKLGGITGHMDARVNGVVVDIKSASQYGFDKFVKGTIFDDDPFTRLNILFPFCLALNLPAFGKKRDCVGKDKVYD